MRRGYDPEDGEAEDRLYDEARQALVDAHGEGFEAGLKGQSPEMCRYIPTEACYAQWQEGRLEGLAQLLKRKVAA